MRNTKNNTNRKTIIYLIRHASYENPLKIFHGRLPGFPLSKFGKTEARRVADFLKHKPITSIYTSPLTRARQTAEILAHTHKRIVQIDDRLLDIKTPLQGKSIDFMESIQWNFFRPEYIRKGGERLSDIFQRMDRCIKELVGQNLGSQIIIVSHGDPIMSVKTKYSSGHIRSRKVFLKEYVTTCGGYCIEFSNRGKVLGIEKIRV